MANKDDSGKPWLEKLVFPLILGIALAGTSPWWVTAIGNRLANNGPSNPDPGPTSAPTPEPSPAPAPAPTPASREIRKQGYIFRLQDCGTTGEVGAIACNFTVQAQEGLKDLQINASWAGRDTRLIDANGQAYVASRIEFGGTGSPTTARSSLVQTPIRGIASFSNIPSGIDSFQIFELAAYSFGDGKLEVAFSNVSLTK